MAWYDACMDWNGDGEINSYDMGIETMVIMNIKDDLEREERIQKMLAEINRSGYRSIDNEIFEDLCNNIGIPMYKFEQQDIDELQRRMDSM